MVAEPSQEQERRPAPAISILTPVWNGMPFLPKCVASVLDQSFGDWELVVSDDGSTDGSRDYLSSLADPRIRVFRQDTNLGIFGNLNFLFQQARGPLTHILCQDDYFLPDALAEVMGEWSRQPAEIAFIAFNRSPPRTAAEKSLPTVVRPEDSDFFFYLFGNIPGNLSCVSLRTDLPARCGWFDQSLPYVGDFDFWSRVGRLHPFVQTTKAVTYVRRHENVASFHLNRKGEYVAQAVRAVNRLYENLVVRHAAWKLKLHGTIIYDAQQRHVGLMQVLRARNATYLRRFLADSRASEFTFTAPLRWALYVATGGAHWMREWGMRLLLRDRCAAVRTHTLKSATVSAQ
jgi:glycosyltransferase involved in cell wall biosynthesis